MLELKNISFKRDNKQILDDATNKNDLFINAFLNNEWQTLKQNSTDKLALGLVGETAKASATLMKHFCVSSLSQLSLENAEGAVCAIGASMDYLKSVQKTELENIKSITIGKEPTSFVGDDDYDLEDKSVQLSQTIALDIL